MLAACRERAGHPPAQGDESVQAEVLAQGDGWYGFFQDVDGTAAMLRGLEEAAKRVERPASLGKLEISITPRVRIDAATIVMVNPR